jgi:hypothetical protein
LILLIKITHITVSAKREIKLSIFGINQIYSWDWNKTKRLKATRITHIHVVKGWGIVRHLTISLQRGTMPTIINRVLIRAYITSFSICYFLGNNRSSVF